MICPCKECKERNPTCHSECPKYRNWKDEHNIKRDADRQKRDVIFFCNVESKRKAQKVHRELNKKGGFKR